MRLFRPKTVNPYSVPISPTGKQFKPALASSLPRLENRSENRPVCHRRYWPTFSQTHRRTLIRVAITVLAWIVVIGFVLRA
jgi:hypothetical protein